MRLRRAVVAAAAIALAVRAWAVERPVEETGLGLYLQNCAGCHGATGRGDGPDAAMFTPRPRDLRGGLLERYDTAKLVRAVRDSEALPLALDPERLRERAGEVEDLVGHLQRLPALDWDAIERGEDLFVARCTRCHGPWGQPSPLLPKATVHASRDLTDPAFQRSRDDRALLVAVRHGAKNMPPVPGLLAEEDAKALVAFVRVLSPGWVAWGRYCASCHGEDGRGGDLVDPGAAPVVRFDGEYLRTHDGEYLRTKVWHMLARQRPAMPHFRGRLNEGQVRMVVDYLKRTER
ncbi:MAG TPA: c-type cytochrome [Candidatus Binatia bacterium]|jgi:mono/diheme cytochrome c family protein|nr:c-type cytochrome [Candidatus Binatia bacterium]